jgi:hypothetical protein
LTIGCKTRVDWMFLRTYSLENYFRSFSFILIFISLILVKLLSYSLLFPNFGWFLLTAQPARALDVSPVVSWHQEMYHLRQSCNPTLLSMFLRGRTPLISWSWYRQEKTHKKLSSYHKTMTMTMIMWRKRETTRKNKKRATRMKVKMMKGTLL